MQKDSSDELEIREMRETDLDEIMAIEKKSFAAPWSKKLFRETIVFPLSVSFVARKKIDNRLVGYANFYLIRNEGHMLNIAITPDLRKKGYAEKLLHHALGVLKEKRGDEFFLEVRESNQDAIKLYRKFGFKMIGRRKKYYRETNEDALVMHLKVEYGSD